MHRTTELHRRSAAPPMLLLAALLAPAVYAEDTDNWPQWRGVDGRGIAPASASPPVQWGEEENVCWRSELPGLGTSTPVVWGDRIFVSTAVDTGRSGPDAVEEAEERRISRPASIHEWTLLALDRGDGSVVWKRVAREAQPHAGTHPDGTHASSSPVTDGEHVIAFFGSQGLYAYTLEGELVWQKDLGDMRTRMSFGEGASPALHGDTLVVNWDHEDESFVVALDKNTGEERWRRDRPEEPSSWSTPVVVEHGDTTQVIVNATHRITSYDLATGRTLWEASGMTLNVIPTPIAVDGVVYVTSGFRGNALMAIDLEGASGDVTGTDNVLWSYDRDTPYVPTPVVYDGLLYMLKRNDNILTVLDASTGEVVQERQRLEHLGNVYASALAADGRIYFVGRDGNTVVIEAGREARVLAENTLADRFDASPVAVGEQLLLRGRSALYCLSDRE